MVTCHWPVSALVLRVAEKWLHFKYRSCEPIDKTAMVYEPNFHHLHTFYEVLGAGVFAKSAERLLVSQPAVTAQIKALQQQLGSPLFDRVGRRAVLNEAGRVVYEYASRVLQMTDELTAALKELQHGIAGRLRVGVSPAWQYTLARALGVFKRTHPRVEPSLEVTFSSRVVEMVLDHSLDLGFVGEPPRTQELTAQKIAEESLVIIAAPGHRFMGMSRIGVAALRGEPFVMREPGSAVRRRAETHLAQLDVVPEVMLEMSSDEAVKQAVMSGQELGITARGAVEVELRAARLGVADVPEFQCAVALYTIQHRQRRLTTAQQRFIEELRAAQSP